MRVCVEIPSICEHSVTLHDVNARHAFSFSSQLWRIRPRASACRLHRHSPRQTFAYCGPYFFSREFYFFYLRPSRYSVLESLISSIREQTEAMKRTCHDGVSPITFKEPRTQPRRIISSRDPTLSSANQSTCRGSGLQVCVQGHSCFKVRTLSRSHARFIEPTSQASQLSLSRFNSTDSRWRLLSCPRQGLSTSRVPRWRRIVKRPRWKFTQRDHATWVKRNERLRRTGAAPALRVQRVEGLHLSPPAAAGMVHGGVARGERTRHVTMATVYAALRRYTQARSCAASRILRERARASGEPARM